MRCQKGQIFKRACKANHTRTWWHVMGPDLTWTALFRPVINTYAHCSFNRLYSSSEVVKTEDLCIERGKVNKTNHLCCGICQDPGGWRRCSCTVGPSGVSYSCAGCCTVTLCVSTTTATCWTLAQSPYSPRSRMVTHTPLTRQTVHYDFTFRKYVPCVSLIV
jgi:hypothetical protein